MSFQNILDKLSSFISSPENLVFRLVVTALIIVGLWLLRVLVMRVVNKRVEGAGEQYRWRKNLTYATAFIGIFIIGGLWFKGFESLATFLGLLTAGLAIALRNPVSDFAGWIFLVWRRPFNIGDRIQIGEMKGDVIDQRIFKFTILEIGNWVHADQSTGRVVHVPNHAIFNESIANYTSDFEFIWNEIPILVTFESNWRKAKKLLQDIVDSHQEQLRQKAEKEINKAAKSYLIYYNNLTPIVYTDVEDSGVNLTVRHLSEPRKRRSIQQTILEDVLDAFSKEEDIDFAYPTMRLFNNRIEGKSDLKP